MMNVWGVDYVWCGVCPIYKIPANNEQYKNSQLVIKSLANFLDLPNQSHTKLLLFMVVRTVYFTFEHLFVRSNKLLNPFKFGCLYSCEAQTCFCIKYMLQYLHSM